MPISLPPMFHNPQHLVDLFAFSLLYAGIVFTVVFILMLTAFPKSFVDWVFTFREFGLMVIFLLTGTLLLYPTEVARYYRLIVSVTLDIIATVLVIALIHTHRQWRKHHNIKGIDVPHVHPRHTYYITRAGDLDKERHPANSQGQRGEEDRRPQRSS